MGATEYLVQNILYSGFETAVYVDKKLSDFFFAQVKIHEGSVLSPLCLSVLWMSTWECEGWFSIGVT